MSYETDPTFVGPTPYPGYGTTPAPVPPAPPMSVQPPLGFQDLTTPPPAQASTAAQGLMTASGPLAFIPAVGPVLSGLAAVGGIVATWYGMNQAEKAAGRAEEKEEQRYQQRVRTEERRYEDVRTMGRKRFAMESRERQAARLMKGRDISLREKALDKEYEDREADRDARAKSDRISQAISMVAGFMRFSNSPENRGAYAQIWKRR